jgi:threonine aldolase
MMFASDNWAGAALPVLEALVAAGLARPEPAYGDDSVTRALERRFSDLFEREVAVVLVPTGTAANSLAVATFTPPWGAIVAHEEGHLMIDECGAPEFYSGARAYRLPAHRGLFTPEGLAAGLDAIPQGLHHGRLSVVSLTLPNEFGLLYTPGELATLAAVAHDRGLAVHLDGARFANAVARLGVAPADVTWRAGVDVLSFGGTKGGCAMAEAIVLFDPARREELLFRRKRAGQLISKHRFVAAQFEAWLDRGLWLDLATHANRMADLLADGIAACPHTRLAWRPGANEVFAFFSPETAARLEAAGARFYDWSTAALAADDLPRDGEKLWRLVTSFATRPEEVAAFLAALAAL